MNNCGAVERLNANVIYVISNFLFVASSQVLRLNIRDVKKIKTPQTPNR